MELNKKVSISGSDDTIVFSFNETVDNDYDYFKKIVGIFSSAFIDPLFHLTSRESELLYCAYTCISSGDRDILSNVNIRKYFKPFKNKKTVQVWIPKLVEKGWLYSSDRLYYINGNFEKFKKIKKINFNITLENAAG